MTEIGRETVVKVKKHGRWRVYDGYEEPEQHQEELPMARRLPIPESLDEEGTFNCETGSGCFFAKMWRYMAYWHENKWIRSYVVQWGRVRKGLPDREAREVAQDILVHFGLKG